MDRLEHYRQLIQTLLTERTRVPFKENEVQFETVFDLKQDRYLVMMLGREPIYDRPYAATRRVHSCLIHLDLIDGKIWIQRDGTEEGIASELVKAGIPKDQIVLGFRSEELRKDTEFAIR
jgi:XisI protein